MEGATEKIKNHRKFLYMPRPIHTGQKRNLKISWDTPFNKRKRSMFSCAELFFNISLMNVSIFPYSLPRDNLPSFVRIPTVLMCWSLALFAPIFVLQLLCLPGNLGTLLVWKESVLLCCGFQMGAAGPVHLFFSSSFQSEEALDTCLNCENNTTGII